MFYKLRKVKYLIAALLVVGQVSGGLIAEVAIIISFFWSFYHLSVEREIDLVLIFLLLFTSIVLRTSAVESDSFFINRISEYGSFNWIKFPLPSLQNMFVFTSIAVTSKLGFALAVPVRIIRFWSIVKNKKLVLIWFLILTISVIGLVLSVQQGIQNDAGITIGFRIVLAIGAIFAPIAIKNKEKYFKQVVLILKASVFSFLVGLLNEHWIFIIVGLLPFLYFYSRSAISRAAVLIMSFIILFLDFTFTLRGTLLLSVVFFVLINKKAFLHLFNKKIYKLAILVLPILLTIFVLASDSEASLPYNEGLQGRFISKLENDRKPLWQAGISQIFNSSLFIVPGGRPIPINDYHVLGESEWHPGAHNIYIEAARQLGLFSAFALIILMTIYLLKIWQKINSQYELIYFSGLLSVYLIFSYTGNSLIYDGVGFLYWLMIGQFASLNDV